MQSATEVTFLRAMARRYGWDMAEDEAGDRADRVIYRVMDLGVFADILIMEEIIGRPRLTEVLVRAPPGALRPRSWWFWHYRLGLADATHDPPPIPVRVFTP